MNRDELHPIDDTPTDPGAYSTLGYLHHSCENYRDKRKAVEEAEKSLENANNVLISAKLEFRWAKENLTKAIEEANAQVEASKERIPEASFVPPDVNFEGERTARSTDPFDGPSFEDATPEQDPASSAPRPRDFDANDTGYDVPSSPLF